MNLKQQFDLERAIKNKQEFEQMRKTAKQVKPEVKITEEEATKILQEVEQKKFEACQKELAEVLTKHGYQISVQAQPILVPVVK